jgi:hypothetical protein
MGRNRIWPIKHCGACSKQLHNRAKGKYCLTCMSAASIQERFWPKVNKHTLTGCWEWMGFRNNWGYGQFKQDSVKIVFAHRFSYQLKHGPIPEGAILRHHCDNAGCVNPDHLELGTASDNSQDMLRRDRCHQAKVTVALVKKLKAMGRPPRGKIKPLAESLGLSYSILLHIFNGRTWTEIEPEECALESSAQELKHDGS